ncbi:MAG: hypothetical protein ACQEVA_10480 [Myxococcota bacterium]
MQTSKWLVSISIVCGLAVVSCGPSEENNGNEGVQTGDLDPVPDKNTPGEYTCEGCPDTAIEEFELNAGATTARQFASPIENATDNGTFYIYSPESGGQLIGTIPTDTDTGEFSFTAPLFCGEQLVKCIWSNDEGEYVLVTRVTTEDCVEPDIRATLTWGADGDDFELHLIKEGGQINDDATDCTWTSCIGSSPDWGVQGESADDPVKDVDNTGAYGPENIFLAGPEDMTYTVMVEHWGSGAPDADGQVILNVDGQTEVIEITDLAPKSVRNIGTIEWPSGQITPSTDVYDCTDEWSSGCTADLP